MIILHQKRVLAKGGEGDQTGKKKTKRKKEHNKKNQLRLQPGVLLLKRIGRAPGS